MIHAQGKNIVSGRRLMPLSLCGAVRACLAPMHESLCKGITPGSNGLWQLLPVLAGAASCACRKLCRLLGPVRLWQQSPCFTG